jgi:hypothetical protein
MRALILFCCAIVVAPARAKNLDTGFITNAEFFELIKDYVTGNYFIVAHLQNCKHFCKFEENNVMLAKT